MPLYEYRCKVCETSVQRRHSMADVDLQRHCSCGGDLRRIVGSVTHKWASSYHQPGLEHSAQRAFLDPEKRARDKDDMARFRETGERKYLKRVTRRNKGRVTERNG